MGPEVPMKLPPRLTTRPAMVFQPATRGRFAVHMRRKSTTTRDQRAEEFSTRRPSG